MMLCDDGRVDLIQIRRRLAEYVSKFLCIPHMSSHRTDSAVKYLKTLSSRLKLIFDNIYNEENNSRYSGPCSRGQCANRHSELVWEQYYPGSSIGAESTGDIQSGSISPVSEIWGSCAKSGVCSTS
uniref:Uncharacterized protein n=1 Tax=Spongospora subterranea TaxID=70186 RepID=A0A0H5RAS3_9EUKA|eukprot:CRZ10876.1 hypothetical protein [Spongospora subterranea]